jgi:hypothetical protein
MNHTIVIVSAWSGKRKLVRTVRHQDFRVEAWKVRAVEDRTPVRWSAACAGGRRMRHTTSVEPHYGGSKRNSDVGGPEVAGAST